MSKPEIIDTPAGPAQLKRTNRKTLAISVLPDGTLELVAPLHASIELILPRVEKRAAWIRTQRRTFREMNATRPTLRYVNGATHRYMGRQYRLKLAKGEPEQVALRGAYLHIMTPNGSEIEIIDALEAWYRRHAQEQFENRLIPWIGWCQQRKLPKPRFRLRSMPKRWGSALKSGTIYLNPELIQAPSACIDYVITHEICHLKHPDHGHQFHRLLTRCLPDWERRKARLELASL
jgi:predicted metal-dependent hydrolase